jgi:hypothetical protein
MLAAATGGGGQKTPANPARKLPTNPLLKVLLDDAHETRELMCCVC